MTTDEVIAQQQKKDRIEAIKGFLGCLVILVVIVAIVGGVVYLTRPEPDPLVKSVDIHFTISFTVTCPTPGTYRTYYEPVCATVNIQCIKAPCDPIKETFSNSCTACINPLVESYTQGECK